MMPRASLVQDLWLGWKPRLRARRLAPWRPARTRLIFQLDAGQDLDGPPVESFLESLAERVEVVAWQPRPAGDSAGGELLEDARAVAADGARAFGERALVLGGYGLGAWLALASADAPGLAGVLAIAPSLASAGATAPRPSALRTALASALSGSPPAVPCLLLEGSDRDAAEARVVAEWLARARAAAHVRVPGGDERLLAPPWAAAVTAWVATVAR